MNDVVSLYIEAENGNLLVYEVPVGRGNHDWQSEREEVMRTVGASRARAHRRMGETVTIFFVNLELEKRWHVA